MTLIRQHPRQDPADDGYQRAVAAAHQKLHDAVIDTTGVRSTVTDSWRRSLELHATPKTVTTPESFPKDTLADNRKSHTIAAVLPMLCTLLAPAHNVELNTANSNTAGHLLWVDGASTMRTRAENIGFTPGTDWSEAS